MKRCAACDNIYDEILLTCPKCGAIPSEDHELTIPAAQIKIISKQVRKEILKSILFWLGILSLIFGIGLWQVYKGSLKEIQKILVHKISEEFKEPIINQTIQTVASNSADRIIKNEIEPVVDDFKTEVESNTENIKKSIQSAQSKLDQIEIDLTALSKKTQDSIEELENQPNFHQEMFSMTTGIPATIVRDYHKALDSYDAKDYERTLELVKQVILEYEKGIPYNLEKYSVKEHNKLASEFYILASKANQRINKHELAYEYSIKANKINFTHYTYYAVAAAAYNLRKYQESLEMIKKALAMNPPKESILTYSEIKEKCEAKISKKN